MVRILTLLLFVLLIGCSSSKITTPTNSGDVDYSVVYMVHADANYTYHVEGDRLKADEQTVQEAIEVGKASVHGEVIIFHQKPERKRFLFFPKKDRVWYHYREGELVGKGSYSPQGGGFKAEAELYQKMSVDEGRKMFFYFGHEIPSKASFTYHHSDPDQEFNTEVFAEDITGFEDHFDLILLSTCNNGNPLMANQLAGKSKYLIASPRNLHLSYVDTQSLKLLEESPSVSTEALADSIAWNSFDRLSSELQTLVTLGVYNLDVVGSYIGSYADEYVRHLQSIQQESLFRDNTDCGKLDMFANQNIPEKGVTLYFSPPAFGREANVTSHSAWGCKQ